MSRHSTCPLLVLALLLASGAMCRAQNQYIGYVYPAGGQQGTTFPIRLGGQSLNHAYDLVVSGDGVSIRLVDFYRVMSNEELGLLRQQLTELKKKETVLDDVMAAKMAWFEFPGFIGPEDASTAPPAAAAGTNKPASGTNAPPLTEKELAKKNLIERIERMFADDQRDPAVRSQTELVFAEVTIAPNAAPGRREIRVITRRGVSNPLPFYIGQVPEIARKPMRTCQLPVLGKESLAQRKRPPEEEELRVNLPCTVNGQIAPGEMNRYRFQASKGQRLVIAALARQLGPYVADGVPGWFQAVIRLHDANGRELAYSDDFRFDPDPTLCFEVPEDGEYILTMNEALFRGRESFVYRITISELPFITDIFPLGRRAGETPAVAMNGWNLAQSSLQSCPKDAPCGDYTIAATNSSKLVSNPVPFAVDPLPECLDQEPNDEAARPQAVTLPITVNGRIDRAGDWDIFAVEGKAGEVVVVEVHARRLGSPMDSFVKVTGPDGKIVAVNDDHFDAGSGFNTDHADSYLIVKLAASGRHLIHLGDTRRQGGRECAYRVRISAPQPDFALRVTPSRVVIPAKGSANLTVFAIRKDGFTGPIALSLTNLPTGVESAGGIIASNQQTTTLTVKTSLAEMEKPVNIAVVGRATAGREIFQRAVPCEDRMQAFLWRHLLPAAELPLLVSVPGYQPPADRVRPPIRDQDRPKNVTRNLPRSAAEGYLRQVENLYQAWLLTDDFANREIATVEARLIQ